jgi:hypothetical protein
MNRLPVEKRAAILAALVDGNSVRATCRITDTAKATVLKLLVDAGTACLNYQRAHLVNLSCKRIQVDEIWSFVGMKERTKSPAHAGIEGLGDTWTFVALDADTKLVPCFAVETNRGAEVATAFLRNLVGRLANRVQLTTDGHSVYLRAVEDAFGWQKVDYGMLVKIYGQAPEGQVRYSPPVCIGAEASAVMGSPDPAHISTSFVERSNLTLRMSQRRFTRLTNAFSKKLENLRHAVALHFMHYNFARPHMTTRITPAQGAGVDPHLWSIQEIAEMADSYGPDSN